VGSPRSCRGAATEATSGLPRYLGLTLSSVQDRTDSIPFSVRERARPKGGGPCAGPVIAAFCGRGACAGEGESRDPRMATAWAPVQPAHRPLCSRSTGPCPCCTLPWCVLSLFCFPLVLVGCLEICCVGRLPFLWFSCLDRLFSCLDRPFSWHTPLPSHLMLAPAVSSSQRPRAFCHLCQVAFAQQLLQCVLVACRQAVCTGAPSDMPDMFCLHVPVRVGLVLLFFFGSVHFRVSVKMRFPRAERSLSRPRLARLPCR